MHVCICLVNHIIITCVKKFDIWKDIHWTHWWFNPQLVLTTNRRLPWQKIDPWCSCRSRHKNQYWSCENTLHRFTILHPLNSCIIAIINQLSDQTDFQIALITIQLVDIQGYQPTLPWRSNRTAGIHQALVQVKSVVDDVEFICNDLGKDVSYVRFIPRRLITKHSTRLSATTTGVTSSGPNFGAVHASASRQTIPQTTFLMDHTSGATSTFLLYILV